MIMSSLSQKPGYVTAFDTSVGGLSMTLLVNYIENYRPKIFTK